MLDFGSKGNGFHRTDEFAKIRIEVRDRGLSEMMSDLNTETIQAVTKIFKLIGDPTRFLILHVLENRELNVNAIAEELDLEQSAVSHQLKKLREAKLVKSRRNGKNILYSQEDQHVYAILHMAVEQVFFSVLDMVYYSQTGNRRKPKNKSKKDLKLWQKTKSSYGEPVRIT